MSPRDLSLAGLGGHRRDVVRVACATVALLAAVLFVVGLPARYEGLRTLSQFDGVSQREEVLANLARLGLSVGLYAGYYFVLGLACAVACFALAALIFV